jgi:hypothetical protein
MLRSILKQILLIAIINMSLCVPQFDLVPVHFNDSETNAIETSDQTVDSIIALICESVFNVDVPFPIHEDAHFLEKDFVVKRCLKESSIIAYSPVIIIGLVNIPKKVLHSRAVEGIVFAKYIGFLALLHYF